MANRTGQASGRILGRLDLIPFAGHWAHDFWLPTVLTTSPDLEQTTISVHTALVLHTCAQGQHVKKYTPSSHPSMHLVIISHNCNLQEFANCCWDASAAAVDGSACQRTDRHETTAAGSPRT